MEPWVWVLAGIGVSVLLGASAFLSAGVYLFLRLARCRDGVQNNLAAKERLRKAGQTGLLADIEAGEAFWDSLEKQDLWICSADGLRLHGWFVPGTGSRDTAVVFVHGYRSTPRFDFGSIASFYYGKGFSLLFAEQRGHGQSEGRFCTFGSMERFDAADWCRCAADIPGVRRIVLSGVSMGAASGVMAACTDKMPSCLGLVVADCGFTCFYDTVKAALVSAGFPWWLILPVGNAVTKIILRGKGLDTARVDREIAKLRTPVLFLHGTADKTVPFAHSLINKRNCPAPARLVAVAGAGHGMAYHMAPQEVQTAITALLHSPA